MAPCIRCEEIVGLEQDLDRLAAALNRRVIDLCRPVRAINNERWRSFAFICRLPITGALYKRARKSPRLLKEPEYWNEPWYRDLGGTIEARARALEEMKKVHLQHWAEELVRPADDSDPAGYYTPDLAARARCYEMGLSPFIPDKYDYSSAAGADKFLEGSYVMDWESLDIVPKAECGWTIGEKTGWKPIYRRLLKNRLK